MRRDRSFLLLIPLVVLVAFWWWTNVGPPAATEHVEDARVITTGTPNEDPASGLPFVTSAELPSQARDTISAIRAGGPFSFRQDGGVFGNLEGVLPAHSGGYYHEYTVVTPGSADRGARRIVVGSNGEFYWTADHYQSFERIRNP